MILSIETSSFELSGVGGALSFTCLLWHFTPQQTLFWKKNKTSTWESSDIVPISTTLVK
jgi:hypothetical protein